MGPCFLFNDVFLTLTSLLGVIPGYPGVISFSEFLFFYLLFVFHSHCYLSCMAPVWHLIYIIMTSINQKGSTQDNLPLYKTTSAKLSPTLNWNVGPE